MQVHMHIYCACSLCEAGVKGMESLLVKGMCVCVKPTAHEAAKMSHIVTSMWHVQVCPLVLQSRCT